LSREKYLIAGHLSKIFGPLVDRIDIYMEVPAVQYKDFSSKENGRSSADILEQVNKARAIQTNRFERMKIHTNARMSSRHLRKFCVVDDESEVLLEKAIEKMGLSARAHARILKIARTIADLGGCNDIQSDHVAEATQYRSLDRKLLR
jgi:magnesium chelatase family protein